MKRIILSIMAVIIGVLSSGCATWSGIKQDSSEAWTSTKRTVHNATAD